MRKSISALIILFLCSTAWADKTSDARALAQDGSSHFALGDFAQAAEKFQAAYMLRPNPALLYNAAQALRLAGNNAKALVLYKNYTRFYPNEANIEEVRAQILKVEAAVAASNQALTAPPTDTAEHQQAPAKPVDVAVAPAAASLPDTTPAAVVVAQPTHTPVYKKWWLWTIVGVVVAGAVVAGVVVGTESSGKWSSGPDIGPGVHSAMAVRW